MTEIKLAQVLLHERTRRGLTQQEVASAMHVSRMAVSKWETAQSLPETAMLPELARYFGMSTDQLLGISTTKPPMTPELKLWNYAKELMAQSTGGLQNETNGNT
jgi:transcriptional regulator with XRE-family HTH domain